MNVAPRLASEHWPDKEKLLLIACWEANLTIPAIAQDLERLCDVRRTTSAIAGKIHRMKLPKHKNGAFGSSSRRGPR